MKIDWIYLWLVEHGASDELATTLSSLTIAVLVLLITLLVTFRLRRIVLTVATKWVKNNKYGLDDFVLKNRVITICSWFIPVVIARFLLDVLFPVENSVYVFLKRFLRVVFIFLSVLSINAILTTVHDAFKVIRPRRAEMLQGFVDAGKILSFVIGIIFMVSALSGVKPWGIFSVLGGLTAVTLLIFRDTILGFVASLQLTMNDMVRVGDWIEMSSYGADGDVISLSIHTVRVQNWDKTITTIPTYSLVSHSFRNWRGMSESGGRRIKRSIMIDISTIAFCDDTLLTRLRKIALLQDYLAEKEHAIARYNKEHLKADDELLINGRRQTNIGVFRAYVIAYLKANKNLREDMTFLVRQLSPTDHGLPLEIYVFSAVQKWALYEDIQADIFDHLFAALPIFELRAFQHPSGYDLARLKR